MSLNFSEKESCPLNPRRMPPELYVKLFVVNFTVLAAYIHLLHLRRDSLPIVKTVLAFCCPLGSTAFIVISILALLIQVVIYRDWDEAIITSAAILYGNIKSDVENDDDTQSCSKLSLVKLLLRKIGRCLLPLALFSQCVTSILLFTRRVEHEADILYDHMILQLAILGVTVAILTTIRDIFQPYCNLRLSKEPLYTRWLI